MIRITGKGTKAGFARMLTQVGCPVEKATIGRWVDPGDTSLPNSRMLWGVSRIQGAVGVMWLLGLTPANTTKEAMIDEEVS